MIREACGELHLLFRLNGQSETSLRVLNSLMLHADKLIETRDMRAQLYDAQLRKMSLGLRKLSKQSSKHTIEDLLLLPRASDDTRSLVDITVKTVQ